MARLQILELPSGVDDERPPFVLVVDQYEPLRYVMGLDQTEQPIDEFDGTAEKIGARGVLVFADTVEIPANDTTAYLSDEGSDGTTVGAVRVRVEPDFEQFREQVQAEIIRAQQELKQAINRDA